LKKIKIKALKCTYFSQLLDFSPFVDAVVSHFSLALALAHICDVYLLLKLKTALKYWQFTKVCNFDRHTCLFEFVPTLSSWRVPLAFCLSSDLQQSSLGLVPVSIVSP
jgi:hypothetical protein